jgi:hypothetical protein
MSEEIMEGVSLEVINEWYEKDELERIVGSSLNPSINKIWEYILSLSHGIENIKAIYLFGSFISGTEITEKEHKFLWKKWITTEKKKSKSVDIMIIIKDNLYYKHFKVEPKCSYHHGDLLLKQIGYNFYVYNISELNNDDIKRVKESGYFWCGNNILHIRKEMQHIKQNKKHGFLIVQGI